MFYGLIISLILLIVGTCFLIFTNQIFRLYRKKMDLLWSDNFLYQKLNKNSDSSFAIIIYKIIGATIIIFAVILRIITISNIFNQQV